MSDRLHVVLRVRALQERAAEQALAAAERRVQAARDDVSRRAGHLEDVRTHRLDASAPGGLRQHRVGLLAAHDAVVVATGQVAVVEAERDRRTRERVAAAVARRSVERIEERRVAIELAAAQRADQAALDEIGAQRRLRAQP